jgi:hypothetical protein
VSCFVDRLGKDEIVLLHLKAILMLVCLKILVIFLICGDVYVKVAHLMILLEVLEGGGFGQGFVP